MIDRRLLTLLIAFMAGLAIVASRLVFIQTVQAEKYDRLARKQRLRSVSLAPQRGIIFDREGEILAMSEDVLTIYATPYFITNASGLSAKLSPLLRINRKTLYRRLTRPGGFSYIARKVRLPVAKKIQAMEVPGLGFAPDTLRRYPNGRLASHVLGFVGMDNRGLAGTELYYDQLLGGREGKLVAEQDPAGRPIPGSVEKRVDPVNGQTLQLTIDRHIQYKAEAELDAAVKQFGAAGGTIVVMDPETGELLALASAPSFDPNNFTKAPAESLTNRAVVDAYEPGSTMKMVTAAAALEEGIAKPGTKYFLQSTIRVADRTIHEAHDRAAREFTLTDIVSHSSNVGAVTLGLKLGRNRLYEYIESFGLTKRTGVDFKGESPGIMPPPEKWSASTIGNVPFGQGIAATPLQMTQAMGIVANGGCLVRPHLLLKAGGPDAPGRSVERKRVLSSKVAAQMRTILQKAVSEGTGQAARLEGYEIGGKTGTAQKAPYGSGKYLASFIGFAPASRPKLVVLVAIDEPTNAIYGGVVAAPAFASVTEFALKHLRIPPKP
ncbi:MAG: penicillin-binding protein 2 [Actinobacteria bacterium]|nr:MAG: penicillin-binding protein 2 [Actinomycetota bacterium]